MVFDLKLYKRKDILILYEKLKSLYKNILVISKKELSDLL